MTDQRFTELLSRKLSDEILADEEQELMLLLAENENYRKEYTALTEYFQDENEEENTAPSFELIRARITPPAAITEKSAEATTSAPSPAAVSPVPALSSAPATSFIPATAVPPSAFASAPETAPPLKTLKRSFTTRYRIAAVLLLGICSFTAYQVFQARNKTDQSSLISWKNTAAPGRKPVRLVLEDGTQVTLNTASDLKYPAAFKGETREVYLNGEAFFEVKKDPAHPFIVHTRKMSIKVLGTAFDVKSYQDEQSTEAALLHGSIQITLKNEPDNKIILKPEEKFVLSHPADKTGSALKGTPAKGEYKIVPLSYLGANAQSAVAETSWMKNKLVFKNKTFAELSPALARWYGVTFIFKSETLQQETFTGEFEKESLTDALKALQVIAPFHYKTDGKTIYLYTNK